MSYDSAVAADSPWGYWNTTEASGSLADSSGNSRTMTVTGSPVYAQAGPNLALDAISWPSSATAEHYAGTTATLSTSAATFEAWAYLSALPSANTPIVASGVAYGTGGVDKYMYVGTDGKVRWYIFNGGQVTAVTSAALSLNAWHHIVASTGAAGTKIRVDKATTGTAGNTGTTSSAAQIFIHGGGIDGSGGNAIDATDGSAVSTAKVAVYASQLSDARTDAHFDAMFATPGGLFAATLPKVTVSFAGGYVPPIVSGSFAAVLPKVAASFSTSYTPVVEATGAFAADLPALSGKFAGEYLGPYPTDTSNSRDGLDILFTATVTVPTPAAVTPSRAAVKYDKSVPYPPPTLVNGRPV